MFWRRRAEERERSLERDIEHHLALETDENIARGMRPEEARYAALRKFGNAGRVREDARAAWTWVWLDTLGGDVRHALRRMARSPGTAALAVVSLALALAPNLTLFSVMDRLLLTPAPVARPETLREIRLRETTPGSERRSVNLSYPEFLDLQRTLKTFQGVAFQRKQGAFVAVNGRRTLTFANLVSDGYFTLLGLTLHLGPGLTTDRPGVVVSHSFWMRTLEGRADAIGRTLLVSGQPFSIQGVAMAGFQGMDGVPPADLWIGIERWMEAHPAFRPMIERRDNRDGTVWARLEPGSGEARAAAEVESVYREMPVTAGAPLAPWIYDRLAERRLGNRNIAFIGVSLLGLVLAVACANVSGVLLARAEERRHETAIRQSLGAPRGRLIREWMVESAALSAIAAAVGLAASRLLIRLLPEAFPSLPVPLTFDFALSARVWWYTGLLAVFSAIAFGAVPAWRASRTDMLSGLRRDLSMRVFHARVPIRSVLIVSQVAVAEVLLFAAGALLHSLSAAERMDPGFDTRRPVALAMALATSEDGSPAFLDAEAVARRLAAIPGVRRAAYGVTVPLSGIAGPVVRLEAPGLAGEREIRGGSAGPGFCTLLGLRFRAGRDLVATDQNGVLVNEALARLMEPTGNVLGRQARFDGQLRTIVGVVEDTPVSSVQEVRRPRGVFLSSRGELTFAIETHGDPEGWLGVLRTELAAAQPGLTVLAPRTLRQHFLDSLFVERASTRSFYALGLLALALTAAGLHGIAAALFSRRMRELAIRMALGAGPERLFLTTLAGATRQALLGLGIGFAIAVPLAWVAAGKQAAFTPWSWPAMAGSSGIVLLVALAAAIPPASRVLRLQPGTIVKSE